MEHLIRGRHRVGPLQTCMPKQAVGLSEALAARAQSCAHCLMASGAIMASDIRENEHLSAPEPNTGVKRRRLLRFGTLMTAISGASALSALGVNSAHASPGDKTPPANYVPVAEKGAASGVATLDIGSKIPRAQLPDLAAVYGPEAEPMRAAFARHGVYDARRSGVVADGITDDRAGIVAAISAAVPFGAVVLLPPGQIRNGGAAIDVPDGAGIRGSGSSVTTISGVGFNLGSGSFCEDVGFNGSGVSSTSQRAITTRNDVGPITRARISRCRFIDYKSSIAILLRAIPNDAPSRCVIEDNVFENCEYAVLMERGLYCRIERNTSTNITGAGRHIVFYSAENCMIADNLVTGGVVGITGLLNRAVAGPFPIQGNVIRGNTVVSVSEEGISLDMFGNDANAVAVTDHGSIASRGTHNASTGQLSITLDAAFAGAPANKFFRARLVITSGAAAGSVFRIDASSGAVLTVNGVRADTAALIAPGDSISIGQPMFANIITGNEVRDAGKWSVVLWGFCIGNVVAQNTFRTSLSTAVVDTGRPSGGVEVWGLDGLIVSAVSQTGRPGRAPSLLNKVTQNVMDRCRTYEGVKAYGSAPGYAQLGNELTGNVTVA